MPCCVCNLCSKFLFEIQFSVCISCKLRAIAMTTQTHKNGTKQQDTDLVKCIQLAINTSTRNTCQVRRNDLTCGKLGVGCSRGVVGRMCLCSRRLMGWQADCCKLNHDQTLISHELFSVKARVEWLMLLLDNSQKYTLCL